MKTCIVAVLLTLAAATSTGSMYNCFNDRACLTQFNFCNITRVEPLNATEAE